MLQLLVSLIVNKVHTPKRVAQGVPRNAVFNENNPSL